MRNLIGFIFVFLFSLSAVGAESSKPTAPDAFPFEIQYDDQGNAKYFRRTASGLTPTNATVFNRVLDVYISDAKKMACRLKPSEVQVHVPALDTTLVWDTSIVCK